MSKKFSTIYKASYYIKKAKVSCTYSIKSKSQNFPLPQYIKMPNIWKISNIFLDFPLFLPLLPYFFSSYSGETMPPFDSRDQRMTNLARVVCYQANLSSLIYILY